MVMSIANNVQSLNAQRSLSKAAGAMSESMGKLSSGTRITRAADDVAGLGISEKLRGEVRGLNQAARNGQDAISMIQTAEGALEEVHTMLQRIRELAVQGSNDTLDDTDRGFINTEMAELRNQINDVASDTEFNGKSLASGALTSTLDKTNSTLELGAAVDNSAVIAVDVSQADAGETYTFSDDGSNGIVLTATNSGEAQTIHEDNFDVAANGETTVSFSNLGVSITLAGDTLSDGSDINTVLHGGGTGLTIITSAGSGSATFQTGADAGQNIQVSFENVTVDANNSDTRVTTLDTALTAFNDSSASRSEAEDIITAVDHTIEFISETRATYGAKQNRLESSVQNIMQSAENLTAAESRIRDVDVAAESANMAKATVLQQAAVSVLAQANQQPQLALKLIG